ncbi:aminomethyl-transferring glycine dehydrogenase subunit GcvPB [Intestinibacter bartlettii]|uniref:Probable glycine dehydrogenase (decarboxylating) subunit 2 n=1 Tax=Intestinibacter bartlettii TaxID=261299 RepID=A0ABS6DT54_9FIRM|nr:aminomethyl-transferring glycine dehydrogenase subunit GcvPB [Intestinibacter bartlettii]MBU5335006.1 aminomethyl-transferring glycine dehydrogenase subunit GcvPB [Intestinibacter bartlettii]MDO5009521.1 aminomethyl-transferring glycine dehydrogenase subunit GcvPB [Intestinibacter bartlettii]
MNEYNSLLIEVSKEGRKSYSLPKLDVEEQKLTDMLDYNMIKKTDLELPELSELDVVRHYTLLSNKNFGVDTGFYPLGSCTMKYNPKIDEDMAALKGFTSLHPYQPAKTAQGALELMYNLSESLAEITGMDKVTLQPSAGAHGEFTGLMIIKAYHQHRGDSKRTKVIVPDSAHGTNPASAMMAGFKIVQVESTKDGAVDIEKLKEVLDDEVAALMLTNPSTLGLFEKNIKEIAELVHNAGGLLYYDGANTNAIMGITRAGDMGFDVVHLNLHKTFAAPHGGGGPGSGPVGVKKDLIPFLPVPVVEKVNDEYVLDYDRELSIGKIKNFYGNFGVIVKSYAYVLTMGRDGLKKASQMAVLNANYLKENLKDTFKLPIDQICKHEFVLSGPHGELNTTDIAKRMLDYGYHPPTIYFPLIIPEALMIEPTESESVETLDKFIDAMKQIAKEAEENPELLKTAPHNTIVKRVDDARAVKKPILTWKNR